MQVIFAIIFISYLVITVVKLIWFLKEEGMSFSIPKVLFLICIITEILLFLFLIDPLGYHQKLNQLQLIMFELNLFFAFLMTIMVVVSFKFLIILLKISQKNKMKPLIYSISFILISVSWIISMVFAYKLSNWQLDTSSIYDYTSYNIVLASLCFVFLIFGAIFLLKKINSFQDNSDQVEEKKNEYLVLSLSVISFSLGAILVVINVSTFHKISPISIVVLLLISSIFILGSPLIIFKRPKKNKDLNTRNSSTTKTSKSTR